MNSTRTRGKKSTPHHDRDDPPRRRANKQPGHGTYDNDRPPIIHIISRESGEERCWVVAHSDKATCHGILAEAVPVGDGFGRTATGDAETTARPTHGHQGHDLVALRDAAEGAQLVVVDAEHGRQGGCRGRGPGRPA